METATGWASGCAKAHRLHSAVGQLGDRHDAHRETVASHRVQFMQPVSASSSLKAIPLIGYVLPPERRYSRRPTVVPWPRLCEASCRIASTPRRPRPSSPRRTQVDGRSQLRWDTRPVRYDSILDAIGDTPLVGMQRLSPKPGVRIWAKLEGNNPTGSTKDRIALKMVQTAEASGELTADKTILEPTSGNTGIALAMVARRKGYDLTVVIPDNASEERITLLRLFGAEIVFSDGDKGTNGSIEVAQALAKDPKYYMPFQYGNPANPLAHYEGTAVEIIRDLPEITHFVAGMGTGGTLTGNGRRLHEYNPEIKVVAAEPELGDMVYGLRSLDAGFIPPIFDPAAVDRKFLVSSADSVRATREVTGREGIFCGISSGAVVHVARRIASEIDHGDIVCLLPDGGWKYLSTNAWADDVEAAEKGVAGSLWW